VSIDGKLSDPVAVTGSIRNTPFPVNIGRNAEIHGQETSVYLCDAIIDQVGIFSEDIASDQLSNPSGELKKKAALWLDFEELTEKGEFYSYGIGARTYGSIWPDRRPQPEMWQIKKSAQPVASSLKSAETGEVEITNRFHFTNLNELVTEWSLYGDGEVLGKGVLDVSLEPQSKKTVVVPFRKPDIKEGVEYRLLLSFKLKEKEIWAEKGFELAWDQLEIPWFWPVEKYTETVASPLKLSFDKEKGTVTGKDFTYRFDNKTGLLLSMTYSGKELLKNGPSLCIWRAPLANETDEWGFRSSNSKHRIDGFGRMAATEWYSAGIDKLSLINESFEIYKKDDQNVIVDVKNILTLGTGRGAFFDSYRYLIKSSGEIVISHSVIPNGDMPSWLPRVGVEWILDKSLSNTQWYGRGPQENYPDRKSGYKTGVYKTTVEKMYEPYLIPQDYGLRCDNRWVRMTDAKGIGLEFRGEKLFNFSAHPYTTENLTKALYTYQLQPADGITFNLDYATSGLGCTALSVFSQYQVMPQRYDFTLTVRPVKP